MQSTLAGLYLVINLDIRFAELDKQAAHIVRPLVDFYPLYQLITCDLLIVKPLGELSIL